MLAAGPSGNAAGGSRVLGLKGTNRQRETESQIEQDSNLS